MPFVMIKQSKHKGSGAWLNMFQYFRHTHLSRRMMSDEFATPLTIIQPLCLIVSLTAFFPFLFSHFLLTEADVNGRV